MDFKIKKIDYKEFKDRFDGTKRLAYKRWDSVVRFGGWLKVCNLVSLIHNKRKKCTYIAITPIGYIEMFGPQDQFPCYVARFEGIMSTDEVTTEFLEENLRGIFEETINWYEEYLKEAKETD